MAKAKTAAPNSAISTTPIPAVTIPSVAIRILKIGNCPSLSGRSTLTYHVGVTADNDVRLRLVSNTGGGFLNPDWVSLALVKDALAKHPSEKSLTSYSLHEIYSGRSANSAPFLFAVLVKEGMAQLSKEKRRCYECTDASMFFAEVQALIASDTDLKVAEKPAKAAKSMAKKAKPEATPVQAATIPPKEEPKVGQQFEPISKQPWPIKEKATKAVPKKA